MKRVVLPTEAEEALEQNFFLETDMSQYLGQWVAVSGKQIVASGRDFKTVFAEAKLHSDLPFIARVPDKEPTLF